MTDICFLVVHLQTREALTFDNLWEARACGEEWLDGLLDDYFGAHIPILEFDKHTLEMIRVHKVHASVRKTLCTFKEGAKNGQ